MKNKFTFPAYAAMATSFLTINAKVEAKAVYTDIDPDSILTIHEGMEIDFNEDGVWDVFSCFRHGMGLQNIRCIFKPMIFMVGAIGLMDI